MHINKVHYNLCHYNLFYLLSYLKDLYKKTHIYKPTMSLSKTLNPPHPIMQHKLMRKP